MSLTDPTVTTATTTSQSSPWTVQQPYLQFLFEQAKNLYGTGGPSYYPESTVAGFSPIQEQAMQAIQNRATTGSPINQAAGQNITDVLSGNYLNSNPYLDQTYQMAADKVMGNINSNFSGAGRYGSGIHQDVMGETLGNLATNIYGGNYMNERQNQMNALQMAPAIANNDYYDYGQLMNVGNLVQQQGQRVIDDNVARYNFDQNQPWNNLGNYMGLIQGTYGQNSTTQTPMYGNSTLENLLGFGLTAAGIADEYDWGNKLIGMLA